MPRGRLATVLLLALCAAAAQALAANGGMPIASSGPALGRGGADTAMALDASAWNTNPAGLAFQRGIGLDLYAGLVQTRMAYATTRDRQTDSSIKLAPGLGLRWDPSRSEQPRGLSSWRVGFGLYPLMGGSTSMRLHSDFWKAQPAFDRPLPDETPRYFTESHILALGPAVALRAANSLALGLSLQYLSAELSQDTPVEAGTDLLQGRTTGLLLPVLGATYQDVVRGEGVQSLIGTARISDAKASGWGLRLGVLWRPSPRVRLGVSYVTVLSMSDYEGDVVLDFTRQIHYALNSAGIGGFTRSVFEAELPKPSLGYAGRYRLKLRGLRPPTVLSAGIALAPGRGWVWALDLRVVDWTRSLGLLTVHLRDGDNPNLNTLTGGGPLSTTLPFEWERQFVLGTGLEYAISPSWRLRGGYNFGSNPVPEDTQQPTHLGIMEHHVTAGISHSSGAWALHLALERALENSQTSSGNHANSDLSGGEGRASLTTLALGLSWRF